MLLFVFSSEKLIFYLSLLILTLVSHSVFFISPTRQIPPHLNSICFSSFPPASNHFSFHLFLFFFSPSISSVCVCSRLVQREQGLSMRRFNNTPRLLDTPNFLFEPRSTIKTFYPGDSTPSHPPPPPHPSLPSTLFVSTCLHSINEWCQLQRGLD